MIIPFLDIELMDNETSTDWWQDDHHRIWEPVAISPMLRFMRYQNDSEHYSHYDAGYFYPDNIHRTLKSLVIYLTTNEGGATRFINDNQKFIPVWERNHSDWSRRAKETEIMYSSYPETGKAIIFNHFQVKTHLLFIQFIHKKA